MMRTCNWKEYVASYPLILFVTFVSLHHTRASAQSLDEAVIGQLEFLSFECERLLNGDPSNVNALVGELAVICQRGSPSSGSGSSGASGGGAGTAANMPDAVRQRLDEDDDSIDPEGPVRGFFLTLYSGPSDRDVTEFQDGYSSDVAGALGGFDREFGEWVAGFTLEYWKQDGDFEEGGDFEINSVGLTVFGNRALGDSADLDFYVGYNGLSNERVRVANFTHRDPDGGTFFERNGLPLADFDAAKMLAGAQFTYGWSMDNVTVGPRIAIDWHKTEFDTYSETEVVDSGLALTFHDDERTSLTATLGIDGSVAISRDFGVVIVSQYLNWRHEFDDKQREVSVSFVGDTRSQRFTYLTDPPDEDWGEFGVNLIFLFHGGFQMFAAYEQVVSHRFLDTQLYSVGIRKEF